MIKLQAPRSAIGLAVGLPVATPPSCKGVAPLQRSTQHSPSNSAASSAQCQCNAARRRPGPPIGTLRNRLWTGLEHVRTRHAEQGWRGAPGEAAADTLAVVA